MGKITQLIPAIEPLVALCTGKPRVVVAWALVTDGAMQGEVVAMVQDDKGDRLVLASSLPGFGGVVDPVEV